MDRRKKQKLEAAGWRFGNAEDFLQLSPEEAAIVEVKLRLADRLRKLRLSQGLSQAKAAKLLDSSQSRLAKMEAADSSVSVDLLMRSLFVFGETPRTVGRAMGKA